MRHAERHAVGNKTAQDVLCFSKREEAKKDTETRHCHNESWKRINWHGFRRDASRPWYLGLLQCEGSSLELIRTVEADTQMEGRWLDRPGVPVCTSILGLADVICGMHSAPTYALMDGLNISLLHIPPCYLNIVVLGSYRHALCLTWVPEIHIQILLLVELTVLPTKSSPWTHELIFKEYYGIGHSSTHIVSKGHEFIFLDWHKISQRKWLL